MDSELSNRIGAADERFVPGESAGELIELEHLARYWWVSGLAAGRGVLDAGCGVGYGTAMLGRAGATAAVGVDVSAKAVAAATAGAPANVSFVEGDVLHLPFEDGRFDLIVCFEVIEHLAAQDELIAELARVLAPAGVLAVSSPNRGVYPPGNPHHVREYTHDELCAALARVFSHVEPYRQHDWMAATLLDDEHAARQGLDARLDVDVAKLAGAGPGTEPYTIALAGRQPLPRLAGRALLGGVAELRELLPLPRVIEVLTAERDALRRERDVARAEVQEMLAVEAALRGQLQIVYDSRSWRLTRPLRAVAERSRRRG